MADLLFQDATVVPMDGPTDSPLGNVSTRDIRVRGDRIVAIGPGLASEADEIAVDCTGHVALPGFVQTHIHYCQTLFRGLADDLPLMDWLRQRIWPLEAAHDAASTRVSARLSVAELLRGGTTTVQVMESIHHAEHSFAVARDSGMTTILGNCLMDIEEPGVPTGWVASSADSMAIVRDLHSEFDARDDDNAGGRLHYAVSPRFILSCSDTLSREAAAYATEHGLRIHTHAGEHPEEVALVQERTGQDYILVLREQGMLTARTTLAHCVHTTEAERQALVETGTAVAHCPTTNLKLGSGIAPIAEYRSLGLRVGLGADGAPCNNRLSALTEIRQAALVAALASGPGTWPAHQALRSATLGGAESLGLADDVGSLEVGKRADILLFDLDAKPLCPGGDVDARLVYGAETAHLRHVLCGGEWGVRDGVLTEWDHAQIVADATRQLALVLSRAGLSA